jgi:hypothetical protein
MNVKFCLKKVDILAVTMKVNFGINLGNLQIYHDKRYNISKGENTMCDVR